MGFFDRLKKAEQAQVARGADNAIVAMADGRLIDVTTVNDPVFSGKALGESVAFLYDGDEVTICAPASGELSVVFPTGHAFGVRMDNGVELLVHIGINTVEAAPGAFILLGKRQGDRVTRGDEIVRVNLKALRDTYDLSTMLIVTENSEHTIAFIEPNMVKKGQPITI